MIAPFWSGDTSVAYPWPTAKLPDILSLEPGTLGEGKYPIPTFLNKDVTSFCNIKWGALTKFAKNPT